MRCALLFSTDDMNRFLHLTDAELWNAFRQDDKGAFAYLYSKFSPVLYRYGYHLCRNRDQTEDCMQDLFVHLYQHRSHLGETNSIKFYLYRSLRRRIAEKSHANSRWVSDEEVTVRPEFELDMPAEAGLIDEQTAREHKQKLDYLLNRLPKRQKEALYLMYFDELSYPDIAQVMGLEIKSVYNLIYNALVSLRGYIRDTNLEFFSVTLSWLLF